MASFETATSSANANVVISSPAGGYGLVDAIYGIYWSYSGGTPTGRITISDSGTSVFDIDITSAGPGFMAFPIPPKAQRKGAYAVTLYAGGAGVIGKLNLLHAADTT